MLLQKIILQRYDTPSLKKKIIKNNLIIKTDHGYNRI